MTKKYSDYELCLLFKEIDDYFSREEVHFTITYRVKRYSRSILLNIMKKQLLKKSDGAITGIQQLQKMVSFYNDVHNPDKPGVTKDSQSTAAPYPKLIEIIQVFALSDRPMPGLLDFIGSLDKGNYKELIEDAKQEEAVRVANFYELITVRDLVQRLEGKVDNIQDTVLTLLEKSEDDTNQEKAEFNSVVNEIIEISETLPAKEFKKRLIELLTNKKFK